MSWIMKANILNIEQVSIYAETKEYIKLVKIYYKWEAL